MAEHGIAPQVIRATSQFDENKSNKRKHTLKPSGPIPGQPVLEDFLLPSR